MPQGSSPQILRVEWGRMEIRGLGVGRDFKLWPGGGRAWDWRETNTHHVPGIQVADVVELLDRGAEQVILTRGMELVLQTCAETLAWLAEAGVEVHVEETRLAVVRYNRLVGEGVAVGGLFHSTC